VGGCRRSPTWTVASLTADGLRSVGGLTTLTILNLGGCDNVTGAVLQHLSSLTALTTLSIYGTSTTQAGKDALKAALPALSINMDPPLYTPAVNTIS